MPAPFEGRGERRGHQHIRRVGVTAFSAVTLLLAFIAHSLLWHRTVFAATSGETDVVERPGKQTSIVRVKYVPKPASKTVYIFPINLIPPLAPEDCTLSYALRDAGLEMQWPITATLSNPYEGPHVGMDLVESPGAKVYAAHAGTVTFAEFNNEGYGLLVTIQYPLLTVTLPVTTEVTVKTHYAHLSRVLVKKGTKVSAGQVVGEVGMTGHAYAPHLHFEVRLNGTPANPSCFLERREKPVAEALSAQEAIVATATPIPQEPEAAPTEISLNAAEATPDPALVPVLEPTATSSVEPVPTTDPPPMLPTETPVGGG